jgi:ATP/maltotriose-dependent transcriptional regulator MalT
MTGAALVGRRREFGALEDALAAASDGEPQVVLVEGEAGVGKSSLVRAFREKHLDVSTLAWAGDDTETQLPFAMVGQLLENDRSWADPYTTGAALLTRLDEAAACGAVLVVLDDAHLADLASLVAVNFAIRRLRHSPVLSLFTARRAQVDRLPSSIRRIADETGRRIALDGLSIEEVQELAAATGVRVLSRPAAKRLRSLTKGNPLHLKALLSEVPAEELEQLDRPLPAPRSFADLVMAELASTSPAARTVATAAAVLGDRCNLADLAAVAGLAYESLFPALDELARLRVLRVAPGSSTAQFEHPLVRAAVYTDLGPAARADLHRAAAGFLEGWLSLRHRMTAAPSTDPALASDLEAWSRRQQHVGNLLRAAEAMLAARRMTPPGPDADRRVLTAVGLYALAGDARSARAHAATIAALPVSGPRLAVQARLAWLAGRLDEAVDLGQQAWSRGDLKASDGDVLAAMLAQIEIFRDHAQNAVTWATRALADGRLEPALASHTRTQRVLGLYIVGRHDDAAAALAELPADPQEVEVARHPELSMRGFLASWEGPMADAQRDLTVVSSFAHGDLQPFRLQAAAALAATLFRSGHWDRSQATLLQTLALAEDMEQVMQLGVLQAMCAAVPAARGEWATVDRHLATALAAVSAHVDVTTAAYADEAAVLLATARGEPTEVVAAATRIRGAPETSPLRNLGIFWWPAHLISALIDLGLLEEAETELALLFRQARPGGHRTRAGRLRLTAQLAAARHDTSYARECFTEALAVPDDYVDVLERALAHEAYGRFLRRRGERRSAVDQLLQARARFEALGAAPFADRCDTELAACGVHAPGAPPAEDPLTPAERAVATLVCAGRTNREAARELVVSVKTVGFHLGNVYAKLGVHSRTQLVEAMRSRQANAPGTS